MDVVSRPAPSGDIRRPMHGAPRRAHGKFFLCLQPEKNTQEKGELFSFFEIFTAEFSHFLVTKKLFFLTKK